MRVEDWHSIQGRLTKTGKWEEKQLKLKYCSDIDFDNYIKV